MIRLREGVVEKGAGRPWREGTRRGRGNAPYAWTGSATCGKWVQFIQSRRERLMDVRPSMEEGLTRKELAPKSKARSTSSSRSEGAGLLQALRPGEFCRNLIPADSKGFGGLLALSDILDGQEDHFRRAIIAVHAPGV